jgi:RimJ/RimL family protein N-acetyltransferase
VGRMEQVNLRDGSAVRIRPIRPDDKDALRRALEHLSPEGRHRRFLTAKKQFSERELAYLTEIDHRDHEALIAFGEDTGDPVGVARYVRLSADVAVAEVAVAVVDEWQGKGVATALLERLLDRARDSGIDRFTATCLAYNREVLDLLREVGSMRVHPAGDLVDVEIDLDTGMHRHAPMRHALRRAAAGELEVRHPMSEPTG